MEGRQTPQEIKAQIVKDYGIETDRDLIKKLGIKQEDKAMLFAWIRYQCEFSYREGWKNGREDLKETIADLILPKQEEY